LSARRDIRSRKEISHPGTLADPKSFGHIRPRMDTTAGAATHSTRPLLWTRLGSFVSLLPLGVWTVNHLWDNLAAFQGKEAWEEAVTDYGNPGVHVMTLALVFVPLFIHTVWGVQRLRSSKPNNLAYGSFVNWRYLLQRLSAVGVLGFLAAHIWLAMLEPRWIRGHAETFEDISWHMRWHWQTTLVYLLGTLGVVYHFANGLAGFAWTWGLVSGRKSQKLLDVVVYGFFVVLLLMAWGVLFAMYRAGNALPAGLHG
jgi:succinate dehydrogenase / fumarate reductase cytochrome b subunit